MMKIFSLLLCLVTSLQVKAVTLNELQNAFSQANNLKIITVSNPNDIFIRPTPAGIQNLFEQTISTKIEQGKLNIIIFNEMFFSCEALPPKEMQYYIDIINKFTVDHSNTIVCSNFLHSYEAKFDSSVIDSVLGWLNAFNENSEYLYYFANTLSLTQDWIDGNKRGIKQTKVYCPKHVNTNECMFSNESFVHMNGKIILKYKKSTYCHEDDSALDVDIFYRIGNGQEERNIDNSENLELAEEFIKNVYLEICWDNARGIRLKTVSDTKKYHILMANGLQSIADDHRMPSSTMIYADRDKAYIEKAKNNQFNIPNAITTGSSFVVIEFINSNNVTGRANVAIREFGF